MRIDHLTAHKIKENLQAIITGHSNGNLGSFSVSTANQPADDIAKSAALQYHEVDTDGAQAFHKKFVLLRKRVGKSKFAKKSSLDDDETDEDEDVDVDEATGEGAPSNDPKYQRIINAHLVRLAQNNALHADIHGILI